MEPSSGHCRTVQQGPQSICPPQPSLTLPHAPSGHGEGVHLQGPQSMMPPQPSPTFPQIERSVGQVLGVQTHGQSTIPPQPSLCGPHKPATQVMG
jgi:hypothetical protein